MAFTVLIGMTKDAKNAKTINIFLIYTLYKKDAVMYGDILLVYIETYNYYMNMIGCEACSPVGCVS